MSEQNTDGNTNGYGDQNHKDDQNNQARNVTDHDKNEHMIPKSRFDQVIQQKREAESALDDIANNLIEEIPEDMRDIIPDLPPVQKIKWITTANKKGFFGSQHNHNGPDSKRPGDKVPQDFSNMSPQAIMALGYKTK